MRIRGFQIEGFGLYDATGIEALPPGLIVICAENGGGKTTLRDFFKAMLFGFAIRANKYLPVSSTSHQGTLSFQTQDGQLYRLQRNFARNQVTLTQAEGQAAPDLSILLKSASLDLYKNVFAVGLGELQDASLLNNEQVRAMIGGFGSAHAGQALVKANKDLDGELAERFKPGGQKPRLNELLQAVEKAQGEWQKARDEAENYWAYETELSDIENQLLQMTQQEKALREQRDHLLTLDKAWPAWIQLQEERRQLAELPLRVEHFPEQGLARLEALQKNLQSCEEELLRRNGEIAQDKGELEALQTPTAILDYSSALDELVAGWRNFEENSLALGRASEEAQQHQRAFEDGLRGLGNWSDERFLAFDEGVSTTAKREEAVRLLREAARHMEEVQKELLSLERSIATATVEAQTARTTLGERSAPPTHEQLDGMAQKVNAARQKLAEIAHLKSDQERRESERVEIEQQLKLLAAIPQPIPAIQSLPSAPTSPPNSAETNTRQPALLIASFILGSGVVIAALSLRTPLVAGVAFGLGVLGAGLSWWLLQSQKPAVVVSSAVAPTTVTAPVSSTLLQDREFWQKKLARVQDEIAQGIEGLARLEVELQELSQAFNTSITTPSNCDQIEHHLQEFRGRRREWERMEQELKVLEKRVQELNSQREILQAEGQKKQANLQAARTTWQNWLRSQSLEENLSPETVGVIANEVARLRVLRTQWKNAQGNQKQLASVQRKYWEKFTGLAASLQRPVPTAAEAARRLYDWQAERDQARSQKQRRELLSKGLAEKQRELELIVVRQNRLNQEYQQLLQESGAATPEHFRTRAEAAQQLRDIQSRLQTHQGRLETVSAPGEAVLQLQNELATRDREALDQDLSEAEANWQEFAQELAELHNRKGQLEQARLHLANSDDEALLAQQLADGKAEVGAVAEEWAVRKLALWLLDEARNKFEQERQPAVLQSASSHLNTISSGQYTKIVQPLGSEKYHLLKADGAVKDNEQIWNSSLREQTYWSLRLGLIEDYATRAEPLPIILDDALVNFDPRHLKGAIECLNEVAQSQQIIYLTCHQHTIDLLKQLSPTPCFYQIVDGKFQGN